MSKKRKSKDVVYKTAKFSTKIMMYAIVLLIVVNGCLLSYHLGYTIFHTKAVDNPPGYDVRVQIPQGTTIKQAAEILRNSNLITSERIFKIQAKMFHYKIKPGEYTFNTSKTSRDFLEMLNEGNHE